MLKHEETFKEQVLGSPLSSAHLICILSGSEAVFNLVLKGKIKCFSSTTIDCCNDDLGFMCFKVWWILFTHRLISGLCPHVIELFFFFFYFLPAVLQLRELHRLYQIQKSLMKKIGSSVPNGGSPPDLAGQIDRTGSKLQKGVDLESPAEDSNSGSAGTGAIDTIEESQIELTLGLSSYNTSTSRSKKDDVELSSSSFSSSSIGSSDHIVSSNRAGAAAKQEQLLKSKGPNHPPWIFQVLSLNSTWRWSFFLTCCEQLENLYPQFSSTNRDLG